MQAPPSGLALHNLSGQMLKQETIDFLGHLGLKFCPLPQLEAPRFSYVVAIQRCTRNILLRHTFGWLDDESSESRTPLEKLKLSNPAYMPDVIPTWYPILQSSLIDRFKSRVNLTRLMGHYSDAHSQYANLDLREEKQLLFLIHHPTLVVLPADKNMGAVLVTRDYVLREGRRHLDDPATYSRVASIPLDAIDRELVALVEKHTCISNIIDPRITENDLQLMRNHALSMAGQNSKLPHVRLLVKVHKDPLPDPAHQYRCRLLVCSTQWITTPISQIVDIMLQPEMKRLRSFIRDSSSLISELGNLVLPRDIYFITFDVENLYPSIPLERAFKLISNYIRAHPHHDLIMAALRFVHEHNYFQFGDEMFKQNDGTAMGTSCAVVLACLFLGILEEKLLTPATLSILKIQLFRRFIDDGLIIAQGKSEDASGILMLLRSLDPNIRITDVVSDTTAIFLDVCIFKGPRFEETGILSSRVYQKEKNLFQYLPTHSAHPGKVFQNLISGELRRYLILSSDVTSFLDVASKFYFRLLRRGYDSKMINKAYKLVSFDQRTDIINQISSRRINSSVSSNAHRTFNLIIPYVAITRDLRRLPGDLFPVPWLSALLPASRKAKIRTVFTLPPPLLRLFSKYPADGPPSPNPVPL